MERPASKRLTDIPRHSIDILRFVLRLTAASPDMTSLFKASGRGLHTRAHAPTHTILDALTLILSKVGHCAAVQDPNQCFLLDAQQAAVYIGHLEELQNVDEDLTKIFPHKLLFNHEKSVFISTVLNYGVFWSVNVEDKPFFSLSSSLCVFKP